MALRPGRTIRPIERPWTRVSAKVPRKSYVVGVPQIKLHQFEAGTKNGDFDITLYLIAKEAVQMRETSMEAARVVAQKFLETKIGLLNYFLKVLVYPHQVIREKPIATGAGADRYSRGMAASFGKPVTSAVQTRENGRLIMLKINRKNLEIGKHALKKFGLKISTPVRIEVEQ